MFNGSQHVDTISVRKSDLTGFTHVWSTSQVSLPGMAPAVVHDGAAGDPVWFVGTGSGSNIKILKMTNELTSNPTITPYTVSVPGYSSMPAPKDPGGTMSWTFDTRILNAALSNNMLVAAHNTGSGGNAKARWYEFSVAGSTPTLVQSGNVGGAGVDTYFPTIEINTQGDLGMTYIESSAASEYMSVYVAGRTTADPLGQMQTGVNPAALKGTSHYTVNRCGDYSGTSVDPSDGITFWSANEFKANSTWNTGFASYSLGAQTGVTHYSVTPSTGSVTAGEPFSVTVTALDNNNQVVTSYQGTVSFTSNDSKASLPGNYAFTASDSGVHTFVNVLLGTAGTRTITATDTANNGITGSANVTVTAGPAASFTLAGFGLSVVAGTTHTLTVTAKDAYGNTATSYGGTVTFSSSDPQASLPPDSQLVNGTGSFPATLYTAGHESIVATDTVDGTITGSLPNILVTPAAFAQFAVLTDAGNPDVAGTPFDITVVAQDAFGNTVTSYRGTATFSSADPYGASLPADYTFQAADQGQVTFFGQTTLYTAGTWDVTATDTNNGLTGSGYVNVQAAPAVALQISAPPSATVGTPFDVSVTAVDPYGNTDTNYAGTITWTSTDPDPRVVLPADYPFKPGDQGQVTFPGGITLFTPGPQTLTVTDTVSGITGNATVNVTTAPLVGGGSNSGSATPAATAPAQASAAIQVLDAVYADNSTTVIPVNTASPVVHLPGTASLGLLDLEDWTTV
jgi:hypothetical protein